jgi:excisionase family DNA binding protein
VFNIIAKLNTYDRLLEVEDVVEVFDFSKSKVYRMAESKQIPAALMGGTWKFDPSALAMWSASKDPNIAKAYRQLLKENREAQEEVLRHFKN